MTREEAKEILTHNWTRVDNPNYAESELDETFFMAIEALNEPKTIIGVDIPHGSDKGIATLFKGKDDKLILEEVKELMSLVRCKGCRHYSVEGETTHFGWCEYWSKPTDEMRFCSIGERGKE